MGGFFSLFKRDTGPATAEEFQKKFAESFENCPWKPHPRYSVFTQYDQEYYLERKEAFDKKYRSFYAVARTIAPRKIIELGASAGASADAYLSGAPLAKYLGFDVFGVTQRHDDGKPWDPYEVARALFQDRRFRKWRLLRKDLRTLRKLPRSADLVVVDAAHDTANEYADLRLALTAKPTFIFVDDADAEAEAKPAIEKFLQEDLAGRVDYTVPIEYMGGGLVIKLNARAS